MRLVLLALAAATASATVCIHSFDRVDYDL
jgi:hypothetical protein